MYSNTSTVKSAEDHPLTPVRIILTEEEIMKIKETESFKFLNTEDDLGRLFYRYLGDTVKILSGNDVVYQWENNQWTEGGHLIVNDLYWSFVDALVELTPRFRSLRLISEWEQLIRTSKKMSTKRAILARAYESSALRTSANDWNKHTHLVGVANGVYDAKTGKLIPNKPEYRITRYSRFKYIPGATSSPFYQRFMSTIFCRDDSLIEYVERALGYSATGSTAHQAIFYCYGSGANGKSTLMSLAEMILGDSAGTIPVENLLEIQPGPRPFLFKHRAKRMLITNETPEGRFVNESAIKQMTGGDTMEVRTLNKEPITVTTQWKPWVNGNYLPRVKGRDEGFWRRTKVIPFNAFIPREDRVGLEEILKTFEHEGDAILTRWLEAAHRVYAEGGFNECAAILDATNLYRNSEDLLGSFITECCNIGKKDKESKRSLFDAWTDYIGGESTEIKSINRLTRELTKRKIEVGGNGNAYYIGISLKD